MSRLPKGNDLLSLRPGSRCPAYVLAVGLRCCNSFPLSLQHDFALELSDAADEVHEKVASRRLVSNSLKAYSGRPSVRMIFCQIAVALAAQSTIDNLFGGLSIFADRPFRIGDSIEYSGEHGIVKSIGLRSTRILSDNGSMSVVPNGHLARISITNVTAIEQTSLTFVVKIKSDATPEQITRCMEELRARALADKSVERTAAHRSGLSPTRRRPIEIDVKRRDRREAGRGNRGRPQPSSCSHLRLRCRKRASRSPPCASPSEASRPNRKRRRRPPAFMRSCIEDCHHSLVTGFSMASSSGLRGLNSVSGRRRPSGPIWSISQ